MKGVTYSASISIHSRFINHNTGGAKVQALAFLDILSPFNALPDLSFVLQSSVGCKRPVETSLEIRVS